MKVVAINGSPRKGGNTSQCLDVMAKEFEREGIEFEVLQPGANVKPCMACYHCLDNGTLRCVQTGDMVNEIIEKAKEADGFIFGTPVYYAHPSGRILSLLDRLFYAGGATFAYKPGAAVASARRSGTTASFDVLNKYFTISKMPVVSSLYWNNIHGNHAEEALQDEEGLQTMNLLGQNMAWLLKCIEAGKKAGIDHPVPEAKIKTNFIR